MTYRQAAFSILRDLRRSTEHTDITINQIVFWIQVCLNEINGKSRRELYDGGDYLSIFTLIPVLNDIQKRYIDLPCSLVNIDHSNGVDYVAYDHVTGCCERTPAGWVNFSRTIASDIQAIYWDKDEAPSSRNPYFYMVGNTVNGEKVMRLYLLGLEGLSNITVELGLLCAANLKDVCDLDSEIPIQAMYELTLLNMVMKQAKFMYLVPTERVQDAADLGGKPAGESPNVEPQTETTDQQ